MAAQPRQHHLPRLNIPPGLNAQQPMFSPALQSGIHPGMHPPPPFIAAANALQTPMQPSFFPQPPGAPGRPMHRSSPSVAQLAAVGMFPPNMPMTPLAPNGFPNQMLGLPPFGQPFVPRSKRSQSISVGGPPKAVLGGPQRKVSPNPLGAPGPSQAASAPKGKKVAVKLPQETVPSEGDEPPTRQTWARTPLPPSSVQEEIVVPPPEITTAERFPSDTWRYHLPDTVDVFLPGKSAWDNIKRQMIDEKLEKLGVERGTGSSSSIPHIHAPHARAASISSPADPALLFFKLNKLQQSQNASASNSLSTSPQPPSINNINISSTSPGGQMPPRFQPRHGHSMSLAQPSTFQSRSPVYNPTAAFNPFGPTATLGSDQVFTPVPISASVDILAPQGRAPANFASLAPPQPLSRPESRPDFMRGFGLDVTEEEEEPPEEPPARVEINVDAQWEVEIQTEAATQEDTDAEADQEDSVTTVAQSRIHSRHVSRLSAALSLRSVGGIADVRSPFEFGDDNYREVVPAKSPVGSVETEDVDAAHDQEAVGEWTGSEEEHRTTDETSDDESIGEWSNPSDEERARHERHQRRILRRAKQQEHHDPEVPRRLPNFPRPPEIAPTFVDQDDIVSNPSEEGHTLSELAFGPHRGHFPRPSSSGHGRPLPPLPETRPGSAPYSYHDPALAHSREASEHYLHPGGLQPNPRSALPLPQAPTTALAARTDLNPLAKPFMFGAIRQSGSWSVSSLGQPATSTPVTSNNGHTRVPSFGKPLNAAAQEFKPTFTFRPPPGVPQLQFTSPQPSRPLPTPPIATITISNEGREVQGREKRVRRESASTNLDGESEDGVNNMSTFKFPPDTARAVSAPTSPPVGGSGLSRDSALSAATFPGFSNTLPSMSQPNVEGSDEDQSPLAGPSATLEKGEVESAHELPYPPTMKPKRAPIPLDFKHPVSTNTVPAGLFKALVNGDGDDRTRRTVRSRLSSRDIFEHSPRPSLDDLNVPTISHMPRSTNRLFTDPGVRESSPIRDIFTPGRPQRRSSLPARHDDDEDSMSDVSLPPVNLSRRIEMQQYEQRLEYILDEKFSEFRRTLSNFTAKGSGQNMSESTEAMISEVVSLFRAQLQASAAKELDNSQMDARGELDFEVIKDILDEKHAESRALIHDDIMQLWNSRGLGPDFVKFAEDLVGRTVNAVANVTSQLSVRMQSVENTVNGSKNEQLVTEVMGALMPNLAALRPEPLDYDYLTDRLTQAVKPHISQLIDLASDKRETAGLIVERLLPVLPSLQGSPPEVDVEGIVGRLTTEVRKIVAPLDAHEIKEQVSDLVVERLDSRLAVRDRTLSVDLFTDKVAENVRDVLAPIRELKSSVEALGQEVKMASAKEIDLSSIRQDMIAVISDLPQQLSSATEAFKDAQTMFKSQADKTQGEPPFTKAISYIETTVRDFAREQQQLVSQNHEFSEFCQDIIKHINTLPEAMMEATKILQNVHADFSARDTSQKDAEEIHKLLSTSADLQVQLAKARGAHGQVRVEKDMLAERLKAIEAERDRLSSKTEELQESASTKTAELAAMEAKNNELEEALSRALDRLKATDVQAQTDSARISQLEAANRELVIEKQQLKSQVESLDLRVSFVAREKDSVAEVFATQRKHIEELFSQQSQWDDLRRILEPIAALTSLVGQVDKEEINELRHIRDRSKALEGEHIVLQRRIKDYESKMAANEKMAQESRQSLIQAQKRAAEWEKRAKEYENELQETQNKLDNAEQAQVQLEADNSLIKLQLEERDAEERLDRDRSSKLRDQIAALEAQVARLRAELDQAKRAAAPATSQLVSRYQNGHARPAPPPRRPDSRASTVFPDSRASTPTAPPRYSSSVCTSAEKVVASSPQQSVWDSMHAPRSQPIPVTPKAKGPGSFYRPPSPTPSTVSTLTRDEGGWWS